MRRGELKEKKRTNVPHSPLLFLGSLGVLKGNFIVKLLDSNLWCKCNFQVIPNRTYEAIQTFISHKFHKEISSCIYIKYGNDLTPLTAFDSQATVMSFYSCVSSITLIILDC